MRFRSAQALLQDRIELEQWLSDIEYALRSLKLCGRANSCTGPHIGQLWRGCEAGALVLDTSADLLRYTCDSQGYSNLPERLREARGIFRECLAETKAELKTIGGVRQLRLMLAEEGAHEGALAA